MRYFELTKDMISDMEKQGFIKVAIYAREDVIKPCENEKLYVYMQILKMPLFLVREKNCVV